MGNTSRVWIVKILPRGTTECFHHEEKNGLGNHSFAIPMDEELASGDWTPEVSSGDVPSVRG